MGSLALRFLSISLGILLLFHGMHKLLHGTEQIQQMIIDTYSPARHFGSCGFCMSEFMQRTMPTDFYAPNIQYITWGVYLGEVVAPLFLIFGHYIRVVSAIVALNMVAVIFFAYQDSLLSLKANGAWAVETPMLYLVIAITLMLSKTSLPSLSKQK